MKPSAIAFLSLACAMPAAAGSVSLDPATVAADNRSTVRLTGQTSACAPIIGHREAQVSGSVIRLSASVESNPAALCLPGTHPYSVDFDLPPLAAGKYTVLMSAFPACAYSPSPCPIAVPPQDTGSLEAKKLSASPYVLNPAFVGAGRRFRLRLAGAEFGCASVFSGLKAEVSGRSIRLSYVHEAHPEALCPMAVGAFGPVFEMAGLEAGVYQVFAGPDLCGRRACDEVALPQWAGLLEAGPLILSRTLWIEPQTLPPGAPAALVLKGTVFTCNDRLTDRRAELKDGSIVLRYGMARTEMMCGDTVFLGQAEFPLPALAAGAYPVVLQPGDCPFNSFLCPDPGSAAVDTLYVAAALGLRPAGGKARSRGRAVPGVRIPWRGSEVDLSGRRRRPAPEPAP